MARSEAPVKGLETVGTLVLEMPGERTRSYVSDMFDGSTGLYI